MNPVFTALNTGYSAKEIIDFLVKSNKKLAPKIKQAEKQGYTPEQIVEFLGGQERGNRSTKSNAPYSARSALQPGYTSQEKTDIANQYRPSLQRNLGSILGTVAENAPMLAGLGGLAYGFGRAAQPVGQVIGNYLSSKFSQKGPSSTAVPPPSPQITPPIQPAPQVSPQTPIPTPGQGGKTASFMSGIIQNVASLFGFRNKPLAKAVANIVEKTGREVADVYNELSNRYDVSTPEKATQAALNKLKEIGEPQTTTVKEVQDRKQKDKETLDRIKPAKEVQERLDKDLTSSVIRKTEYDPGKGSLKVVFNNNHTYSYEDVPEDVYNQLTEGAVAAKTKGENQFGRWWIGKKPSTGAAFNKLIKQGGYNFTKGPDSPLSEEEEAEYKSIASSAKEKQKEFSSGVEKSQKASEKISRDIIDPEKVKFRSMAYRKTLEELRKKSPEERNEKLIDTIEERLKTLSNLDKLRNSKKSKVLTEEVIRFEKAQGKSLLKKLLILLPASIVKVLRDKVENTDEEDILKFVRNYLSKGK